MFSVAPRIDFAFARVAYGKWPDPEFLANWKIMKKQGVYRGAYLFFRLDQDPIEQVDVAVGTIGAPAMRDLCLTIDIERPLDRAISKADRHQGSEWFRARHSVEIIVLEGQIDVGVKMRSLRQFDISQINGPRDGTKIIAF
ncbi:hypothetical protein [Paraburkholderia youngii]|uniref:hypothetical protein n=1 Tax=Paraburkholderia youngii TaxID=2782701 RepID=UPI0020CC15D3|nr:hypothetical protein [Paraburkholderia youngii]